MVDRDELKSFCRFLEEASDLELRSRLKAFDASLEVLPRGDARSDFQFLKRKLEEEIAARIQVEFVSRMNRERQHR